MLIDTLPALEDTIKYLDQFEELTVDTETNGLTPYKGSRICGVAIQGGADAFYLPFRHRQGTNLPIASIRKLDSLLGNPDRRYIGFNYKFDLQMLSMDGIPMPRRIYEVLAAAHLMNENENTILTKSQKEEYKLKNWQRPSFKLKYLGAKYISNEAATESDVLIDRIIEMGFTKDRNAAKGFIAELSPAEVDPYACQDTQLTKALHEFYIEPLKTWRLWDLYLELCEYHIITTKMEMRGLKLDLPLIHEYIAEADRMLEPARKRLNDLAGHPINPNSHKQVQAAIELPSTAKDVLEGIIESENGDPRQKEFAQALVDYRGWNVVNSSCYYPYLKEMDDEGIIHPNLSLIGTISGRLSCYSPNLQGVPRYSKVYKVKDVFVARPGYTFVSCDYQQAEMRLAAHYMQVILEDLVVQYKKELSTCTDSKRIKHLANKIKQFDVPYEDTLQYILQSGISMHTETQKSVFGTSDKSLMDYDYAKRTNFSVIYGIGAATLSERLRLPLQQCSDILRKYHARFPGFRVLYNTSQRAAEEMGYIRMWTGRIRHYGPGVYEHKASSNLIQGGVAEIMRVAILRLDRHYNNQDVHMLLQVHDQIIFEVPEEHVFTEIPVIKQMMEDFPEFEVQPKIDVKYGPVWGKMKEWKEC